MLGAVAAISVVSGLAQAWQSEKARGANQKELDRIRKLFEELVPPEYDLSPNDPPQYITRQLQGANLDLTSITPEQFKVIGTYAPQAAEYVAETNPQLVQQTGAGAEGRQAQIDALREFRKIASGENPELKAKLERAARASQIQAQSRTQSLLQDQARRGMLGSGMGFAAMLQGNSDAMLEGSEAGRDAAIEAYRSKLAAIQQSGTMGRQLAQDELGQQQTNADIINQFNQRTSRAYQDYLNNRSNLMNQAQLENLRNSQGIANMNVEQNNKFAVQNQQNRNTLAQQQYANERDERNYQNDLAFKQADWARTEKDRQNDLKSNMYQNQLARANGMSGLASTQMQQNSQNAADRNSIINAIGSSAAGYYGQKANQDFMTKQAQLQREADAANWDKYLKARQGA